MNNILSENDKQLLKSKGISEQKLDEQLLRFKDGFPFLKIHAPAIVGKGIVGLTKEDETKYESAWNNYIKGDCKITKFVPASGAASRMFKDLFNFLEASYMVPTTAFEKEFFDEIDNFAFYNTLNEACKKKESKPIKELIAAGKYKEVVDRLLASDGLNYGNLPKGLLEFHRYADTTRTPVEEHMVEGALYASSGNKVNLHFTVSTEHKELFENLIARKQKIYEEKYGVKYTIGFSEQKASTDTLAANIDNTPFRENGNLLFRPGGHGALIENLNDIDSDIIYVKNVDNSIPDRIKETETLYKKILGGVLVSIQKQTFQYLKALDKGDYNHDELIDMLYFLQNELNTKNPDTKLLEDAELALYIKSKLDRPMRVCGMVKNEGEPGGGPFLTENADHTISLQILESSQIDLDNKANKEIVKNSTHFNPVDLVCGTKCYKGDKYKLLKYVDKDTGFISNKSQNGKSLKALELPGLWNGAMSDWNTIFVEVPIKTFNPVKTVNDLLRENHL